MTILIPLLSLSHLCISVDINILCFSVQAGEDSPERGSVQTVVKTIMDSVSGSEDPALNITAGWRLGQLYMEAASKATGNAAGT